MIDLSIREELDSIFQKLVDGAPRLLIALMVCALLAWVFKLVRIRLIKLLRRRADDTLLVDFLSSIMTLINRVVLILIFLYLIKQSGIANRLLGAAGISAFVIGFAFRDIGENLLAGIMMAFNRPFRIGDTVKTGDITGTITTMSMRDTHIKTFDGIDVYVPNGQIIKNPFFNYTIDGFLRQDFDIKVEPTTNIDHLRRVVMEEVESIPGILKEEKKPKTILSDISDANVKMTVQYWVDTFCKEYSSLEIKTQAMKSVLDRLNKEGISRSTTEITIAKEA